MKPVHDDENYVLIDEYDCSGTHVKVYYPKPNPGETLEDVNRQVDIQTNFLFSVGLLESLLDMKAITKIELNNCIKDLKNIYQIRNEVNHIDC